MSVEDVKAELKGVGVKDVLFFNSMLTPKVITVVYWLALAGIAFSGLKTIFAESYFGFLTQLGMGLGILIGGTISARIGCELLIVLFSINDNIKKMNR